MEETNDARQLWLAESYTAVCLKASQGKQLSMHKQLLDAARSSSDPKVRELVTRYDAMTEQVSLFTTGKAT